MNPQQIRDTTVTRGMITIPCGRCENCLKRKVSAWSFRLMQEDKYSDSSYFLTLTYGINTVPLSKNRFMEVRKRDLQLFFKRLRKAHEGFGDTSKPIKYYAVGEYGGKFKRPHYHIILFNARLECLINPKLAAYAKRGLIELDGTVPMDCKPWQHGHCTIGTVSGASVGYTMKYVAKPAFRPMHKNDDRMPEFSLSSQNLGLGYLTEKMKSWHRKDITGRQYVVGEDGKKYSMPRYYRVKLLTLQEKEMLKAWNRMENMKPKTYENTARERGEALLAGIRRHKKQLVQNQKL